MQKKLLAAMQRLMPAHDGAPYEDKEDPLWQHGHEKIALLYAMLYLPDFVEVEGSIICTTYMVNRKQFPQDFINAKKKVEENGEPLWEIEDSFNYLETSYIFNPGIMENITDEDDLLFAECVAEAWRGRLCYLYPKREFKVYVVGPPESGDAYGISFYEIR